MITYDYADEIVEEVFESLLSRHQIRLETSMKGCNFIFDGVKVLFYKRHKIDFKRGGSYILILQTE